MQTSKEKSSLPVFVNKIYGKTLISYSYKTMKKKKKSIHKFTHFSIYYYLFHIPSKKKAAKKKNNNKSAIIKYFFRKELKWYIVRG